MPAITIREMRKADLAFAAECTAGEGWASENRATLEGFFTNFSEGCLLAEENGQPTGICVATPYGSNGFIGELIVHPEWRGKGVGAALLNHGVQILKAQGAQTIYLDGVVKAVDLYERNGFHKLCRSWRFSGHVEGKASPMARRMVKKDLAQVIAFDQSNFGAERGFFLRYRFTLYPRLCNVMMKGDELVGYIQGRAGEGWVSAGPWVVSDSTEDPLALLHALPLEVGKTPISIGILDTNRRACELVRSLGFVERVDSPWRMALGRETGLGLSPNCFAVGSAAKG